MRSHPWMLGLLGLFALCVAQPLAAAERPVEIPGPLAPLRGLLSPSPAKPPRVAVIIPGSGPTDRDGNNPLGVKAATYRLLAEGLVAEGIATIRYDKRGMFASRGAIADADAVTLAEYGRDAHEWASLAARETGAPCVWLIGHSEGGLVALIAAENKKDICGLILIAAPGRRAADVLRDQLRANPANAPILPQALAAIEALEAGRRFDTTGMPAVLDPLFRPSVQGFLIDLFARDPAALAAAYEGPLLIISGGRDLQVGRIDGDLLAKGNKHAKQLVIPNMNHVGKPVGSDSPTANLATYGDPNLPLAADLVKSIGDFIVMNK